MNEIIHIIQREYVTRVRTKTFIIVTLLTPLLLSFLIILPLYFASQHGDYTRMKIGIVDLTRLLEGSFEESEFSVEWMQNQSIDEIKHLVLSNQWEGILNVERFDSTSINVQYYSLKQPSIFLQNQIRSEIERAVVNKKLSVYGIKDVQAIIRSAKQSVTIDNIKVGSDEMQMGYTSYRRSLCLILGLTIYLFVFLFSSQVMRGVQEEKSNRIVELIITSISPVKFMTGKIIGIALLGLTQIGFWLIILHVLSIFLSSGSDALLTNSIVSNRISQEDVSQILNIFNQIDFNIIVPVFLFFFIGGYLLYSSLFAAIAAIANNNDDLQQISTIVTLPLILGVIILSNTVNSPDSSLSYWFSIIPFTSPIVMTGRAVYGAPIIDIFISMILLIVTVSIIFWLSGKIYKTAIVYSGKKVRINDIISWMKKDNQ